ncbi:hypothetical protein JCM10212_006313 [Sporobolomyces blumeae]
MPIQAAIVLPIALGLVGAVAISLVLAEVIPRVVDDRRHKRAFGERRREARTRVGVTVEMRETTATGTHDRDEPVATAATTIGRGDATSRGHDVAGYGYEVRKRKAGREGGSMRWKTGTIGSPRLGRLEGNDDRFKNDDPVALEPLKTTLTEQGEPANHVLFGPSDFEPSSPDTPVGRRRPSYIARKASSDGADKDPAESTVLDSAAAAQDETPLIRFEDDTRSRDHDLPALEGAVSPVAELTENPFASPVPTVSSTFEDHVSSPLSPTAPVTDVLEDSGFDGGARPDRTTSRSPTLGGSSSPCVVGLVGSEVDSEGEDWTRLSEGTTHSAGPGSWIGVGDDGSSEGKSQAGTEEWDDFVEERERGRLEQDEDDERAQSGFGRAGTLTSRAGADGMRDGNA